MPAVERAPVGHAPDAPRPYGAPQLIVFGDLARLTMQVGTKGKKDASRNRRTGF